jgi:allantoinase
MKMEDRDRTLTDTWVLRGRRIIFPDGIRSGSVVVRNGLIQEIGPFDRPYDVDAGELLILPGLVDTHVHINEPGRADWEGFESATLAAAAGGITTLVDMPLNSIPVTTSVEALENKRNTAEGKCWVDVGFWGGIVPGNLHAIRPLLRAGCLGFKCFLTPSGIDEFAHIEEYNLRLAMLELSGTDGVLLAHAELPGDPASVSADRQQYLNYMNSRPCGLENSAIDLLVRLSEETGCRIHIVHLSSAEALSALSAARTRQVPVTVET